MGFAQKTNRGGLIERFYSREPQAVGRSMTAQDFLYQAAVVQGGECHSIKASRNSLEYEERDKNTSRGGRSRGIGDGHRVDDR
jgi:hypothetical protein